MSAARLQPVSDSAGKRPLDRTAVKEGARETLLNSVGLLSDIIDDFRSSDRFFKYKAMVLGIWLVLTSSTFLVACPGRGPSNDINATLVIGGEPDRPIYMVKNESAEAWGDVEIIVNGAYRSTMTKLEANGGSVTLSSAVIFDTKGNKAPSDLRITDIEVHTLEPEARVKLLAGGQPAQ